MRRRRIHKRRVARGFDDHYRGYVKTERFYDEGETPEDLLDSLALKNIPLSYFLVWDWNVWIPNTKKWTIEIYDNKFKVQIWTKGRLGGEPITVEGDKKSGQWDRY